MRASLRNQYKALWDFSHGNAATKSLPTNLQIARSNLCNFKCVYCIDHREGNSVARSKLEGDVWEGLSNIIPKIETMAFHGISEFMMDPEFFNITHRCAESGVSLSINTNGSVCTPKYLDTLGNYPNFLLMNFSIDAATAETFSRIRGWHFNRVIRNITFYVERFRTRKALTHLTASFVITKSNLGEMVPFVQLAKDLGMTGVKFYRLHEYDSLNWTIDTKAGGPFDYRSECVTNFPNEYNQQIHAARDLADEVQIMIDLPAPIPTDFNAPI